MCKQQLRRNSCTESLLLNIQVQMSTWYFLDAGNKLLNDDVTLQRQFHNCFMMTFQSFSDLSKCVKPPFFFSLVPKESEKQTIIKHRIASAWITWVFREGVTFDNIEEPACISAEKHRRFLYCFLEYGSMILFNKFDQFPIIFDEAKSQWPNLLSLVFLVVLDWWTAHILQRRNVSTIPTNHHLGAKLSHTTRSFSLNANHLRCILHTSTDQTMVMYDAFIKELMTACICLILHLN